MRRWQVKPQFGILGIASFSALVFMPIYLLWLPSGIGAASWGEIALQCVYQGVIASMLAAGFYSYAVQKVGAGEASMMLALVPAFTAIGAYLILDEALGTTTIVGIVVVSAGALLGALPPARWPACAARARPTAPDRRRPRRTSPPAGPDRSAARHADRCRGRRCKPVALVAIHVVIDQLRLEPRRASASHSRVVDR